MFKKYILASFLLIINLISINCFAFDDQMSVAKVEGNRVYLKPGSIQIANNGIFIQIKGELHAVEHLNLGNQGVYFEDSHSSIVGDCPFCGDATVFGVCLNGNCPSKRYD